MANVVNGKKYNPEHIPRLVSEEKFFLYNVTPNPLAKHTKVNFFN